MLGRISDIVGKLPIIITDEIKNSGSGQAVICYQQVQVTRRLPWEVTEEQDSSHQDQAIYYMPDAYAK